MYIDTDSTSPSSGDSPRESRYQLILEGLNVVPWEFDWRTGAFTYIAGRVEEIFGWPHEKWLAPGFWAATIHPDDQEYATSFCMAATEKGEDHDFEYRLMTADGGFRWVHDIVRVFPNPNGGSPILRGVFVDVTPRRLAEEEQKKAMVELAIARDRAHKALSENEALVSLVAHDLKSPLTTMEGFIRLLKEEYPGAFEDQTIGQMVEALEESLKRANGMVAETLRLNRFRSGSITLHPRFINASFAALSATANYGHLALRGGIKLDHTVPEHIRIFVDPTLLGEALGNLVTNALKFTHRGGSVTVEWDARGGFTVADTGIGVAPDLLPYLFDLDHATTSIGLNGERGTGLGLPFCRDIARAHGGDIVVESTPGKGARFTLLLPQVTPRVMVIDDEPSFRFLITQPLLRIGVEVIAVNSGKEALALIDADPPHLVLTDLSMPGIDGFELLEQIKGSPATRHIPVILVTADTDLETRQRAVRLGVDDFMSKPIRAEELIPRVTRFTA